MVCWKLLLLKIYLYLMLSTSKDYQKKLYSIVFSHVLSFVVAFFWCLIRRGCKILIFSTGLLMMVGNSNGFQKIKLSLFLPDGIKLF